MPKTIKELRLIKAQIEIQIIKFEDDIDEAKDKGSASLSDEPYFKLTNHHTIISRAIMIQEGEFLKDAPGEKQIDEISASYSISPEASAKVAAENEGAEHASPYAAQAEGDAAFDAAIVTSLNDEAEQQTQRAVELSKIEEATQISLREPQDAESAKVAENNLTFEEKLKIAMLVSADEGMNKHNQQEETDIIAASRASWLEEVNENINALSSIISSGAAGGHDDEDFLRNALLNATEELDPNVLQEQMALVTIQSLFE